MVNKDFDWDEVWFTQMVYETTHVTIASSINTKRVCFLHHQHHHQHQHQHQYQHCVFTADVILIYTQLLTMR